MLLETRDLSMVDVNKIAGPKEGAVVSFQKTPELSPEEHLARTTNETGNGALNLTAWALRNYRGNQSVSIFGVGDLSIINNIYPSNLYGRTQIGMRRPNRPNSARLLLSTSLIATLNSEDLSLKILTTKHKGSSRLVAITLRSGQNEPGMISLNETARGEWSITHKTFNDSAYLEYAISAIQKVRTNFDIGRTLKPGGFSRTF